MRLSLNEADWLLKAEGRKAAEAADRGWGLDLDVGVGAE